MQKPLIHQHIILQTERLREIHRTIMLHASPVPSAEVEALLVEIRNLYKLAIELHGENALLMMQEVQLAQKDSANPLAEPKTEEAVVNPIIATTPPTEKISSHPNHAALNRKSAATIANRFSENKTIGEAISDVEPTKRLSDQLRTPFHDLKSSIGLNDKFQFINGLFRGNSQRYNEVINHLGTCSTKTEAIEFVHTISEENDWEGQPASAKLFMELIDRRFNA